MQSGKTREETVVDEATHFDFTPSWPRSTLRETFPLRECLWPWGDALPRLGASLPLSSSCEWMCAVPKSP